MKTNEMLVSQHPSEVPVPEKQPEIVPGIEPTTPGPRREPEISPGKEPLTIPGKEPVVVPPPPKG